MSEASLQELEREVRAARARLEGDLLTLRSPATMAEFTADLKQEALDAKSALIEQAQSRARTAANDFIETVKAKAAANPAAVLAIGAGLAWRLVRRPPIATALVGAGLFSLLRTTPIPAGPGEVDYLSRARERLKEQASDFGTEVKARVIEAGDTLKEQASELASSAGETLQRWETDAGSAIKDAVAKDRGDREETLPVARSLSGDRQVRNNLLLGVAAMAVAAAMSAAYNRRPDA